MKIGLRNILILLRTRAGVASIVGLFAFFLISCTGQTISLRSQTQTCVDGDEHCDDASGSKDGGPDSAEDDPTPDPSPTPKLNFSGLPSGSFNASYFDLSFASSNVFSIKYKIGVAGLTDCSDSSGYSAPLPASTPVTIDTSSIPDGTIKLCVVSQYADGSWQTYSDADAKTWIQDLSPVVEARWSAAPNWNDYVSPSNGHVACNAASDTDCIHGGEYRKVATSISSCAGLALSDDLDLFNWTCQVEGGVAVFLGKLKYDTGLAELVTHGSPTGSWNSNYVTLTGAVYGTRNSTAGAWWTNPVVEVPSHVGSSVVLGAAYSGKIVTDNSVSLSDGININADKVGLFFASGSNITGTFNGNCNTTTGEPSSTGRCPVATGNQNFLWVEGLKGIGTGGTSVNVLVVNTKYSRFRDIRSQLYGDGVNLTNVQYCRFEKIYTAESGGFKVANSNYNEFDGISAGGYVLNGHGAWLDNSSNNRMTNIRFFSTGSSVLQVGGDNNVVTNYYGAFNANGVAIGAWGNNNFFAGITAANLQSGVSVGGNYNIVHSALIANVSTYGLTNFDGENNTYSQIALAHTGVQGVYFYSSTSGQGDNNKIAGNLLLGNTTGNACTIQGTGNNLSTGGVGTNCTPTGGLSVPVTNLSLATSFVGKVTSETSNAHTSGAAAGPDFITDWLSFDTSTRGWGRDGSAFPNANNRIECYLNGNACRIWDFALLNAVSIVRDRSDTGTTANDPFVASAACPTQVNGNVTLTNQSGSITYLKNAIEMIDGPYRSSGNLNGLCEANETCLYTPNFGAYQGEGFLDTCVFSASGGLSGITMYGYSTNGR